MLAAIPSFHQHEHELASCAAPEGEGAHQNARPDESCVIIAIMAPLCHHSHCSRLQVILMAGLQGVGKTTVCGKLALALAKQNKKVLLVATDVYRPAAIDQLKLLGERVNTPVFELGTTAKPADIARQGVAKANQEGFDAVIIDTAGRLQVQLHPHTYASEAALTMWWPVCSGAVDHLACCTWLLIGLRSSCCWVGEGVSVK